SAPIGTAATPGNSQVALSWNAITGATSYSIYRGTATGVEAETAIVTEITGITYTNVNLTNGTTYFYKVAAVNGGGTSTQSNEASATPEPPMPPAPTVTGATAGDSQVALSWTPSTGATSYNVCRHTTTPDGENTTAATGVTGAEYTDTGLINGKTYCYAVQAVNAGGTSTASNQASATPYANSDAPQDLSSTARPDAQATIYWSEVADAKTYNVYRGNDQGSIDYQHPINGLNPVRALEYTDTGLTSGHVYWYAVATEGGHDYSTVGPVTASEPFSEFDMVGNGEAQSSGTSSSGNANAGGALGVRLIRDNELFLLYINPTSPVAESSSGTGFGSQLLSPGISGQSAELLLGHLWEDPFKNACHQTTGTYMEHDLANFTFTDSNTSPSTSKSGAIMANTFGFQYVRVLNQAASGDSGSQKPSVFGAQFGFTDRVLMGDAAGDAQFLQSNFNSRSRFYWGFEGKVFVNLGDVQPFTQITFFPGSEGLPGFSGAQVVVGVDATTSLFSKSNAPAATPPANQSSQPPQQASLSMLQR
ncbi:MAG: fibronectin type III domain-containing protein, partial [Capsulimonadaceae bacterium]